MAQTKRKRQTKHRGNAAGVVESRGRTGRKPTAAEKSGEAAMPRARRRSARQARSAAHLERAFYRAMIAAILLLLMCTFLIKKPSR